MPSDPPSARELGVARVFGSEVHLKSVGGQGCQRLCSEGGGLGLNPCGEFPLLNLCRELEDPKAPGAKAQQPKLNTTVGLHGFC